MTQPGTLVYMTDQKAPHRRADERRQQPAVLISSHKRKPCRGETGNRHSLFVVPVRDVVVLILPEEVTAVLSGDDAVNLCAGIRAVSNCAHKGRANYARGLRTVFLEERAVLGELKRLAKKAPDYIADFESGDLSIEDQNAYALRLLDTAERLMMHAKARDRVANS